MRLILILTLSIFLFACDEESDKNTLWPGGRIPYEMLGFNSDEAFNIYQCMLLWEFVSAGRIKFINMVFDENSLDKGTRKLHIYKGSSFGSSVTKGVGYYKYCSNIMILGNIDRRSVLHELAHIIGLQHEHQRPDRDLYISVNWNMIEGLVMKLQYIWKIPDFYDYKDYPYDYQSITHYTQAEAPCLDGHGNVLGGDTISFWDAIKVQDMYDNFLK